MENPNLFKFDATVVSIDGYVMTITLATNSRYQLAMNTGPII